MFGVIFPAECRKISVKDPGKRTRTQCERPYGHQGASLSIFGVIFPATCRKNNTKTWKRRIRAFMRRWLKHPRTTPQGTLLSPPAEAVHNPFPTVRWRSAPTSQDAITSLALYLAGLHRLTTRVPHAHYFGVTGVHCTPELYEFMGFNGQGWWRWSLDDVPTTFAIRYKDESGEWLRSSYR